MSESTIIEVPSGYGYDTVQVGTLKVPPGFWEVTHSAGPDSIVLVARRVDPVATATSRNLRGDA